MKFWRAREKLGIGDKLASIILMYDITSSARLEVLTSYGNYVLGFIQNSVVNPPPNFLLLACESAVRVNAWRSLSTVVTWLP